MAFKLGRYIPGLGKKALVEGSEIAADTVQAGDLAPDSVGSSELADNAVDAAALATDAVETAKIKDANVTTGKIADGAVTSDKVEEDLVQYVDVQLTNAQMLALRAEPVDVVAAPGANKALVPERIVVVSDATAGAWTESADNIVLEYADGTDVLTIETGGLIDQEGAVQVRHQAPAEAVATPIADSALRLLNSGDGEFGGGNAANTFSVRVYFRVIPTIPFT